MACLWVVEMAETHGSPCRVIRYGGDRGGTNLVEKRVDGATVARWEIGNGQSASVPGNCFSSRRIQHQGRWRGVRGYMAIIKTKVVTVAMAAAAAVAVCSSMPSLACA